MKPAAISPADTHKARKAYAFNYQNRPFLGRLQRESPFFIFIKKKKKIHYYLVICQISTTFAPVLEEEDI